MHPELIRAEIKMRGKTLSDLARQYEVSPRVVSLALKAPSLSGEKVIAKFLDKPLHELWPERWTRTGQRIRPRYRHLYKEDAA
ncbi:helix-turn-helix domain-containing protein [Neisseria montereyensis]|uniref:Helix-turn-helix domain-containing protein n=1 Tax=Neisseria montereyensis TaxID=2973938 RepID=A0ABT2FDN3_9NEIS|nr:helix-turn-helix domain-containing protein [Neisseria montereyensis]MCS4534281.1 helix-turn-helix domain-containing protein [Neisseria montereyensis]